VLIALVLSFGLLLEGAPSPAAEAESDAVPDAAADEPEAIADPCEELQLDCLKPWTGDLDGMVERRMIRVLTVLSKTFYYIDRGVQRGITYEGLQAFEKELNNKLKLGPRKVNVVVIPVSRDRLLSGLVEGRGDIVAANLTITEQRAATVDFSDPVLSDTKELLVTGPASPPTASLDDLAGREVVVRRSSSYYESLVALNERFRKEGKAEVALTLADENLEDEDLLEMVNAGLYPAIVMDEHKAQFWAQIFDKVTVHDGIVLRAGGQISWAFRKNSPQLRDAINRFVKGHKIGTQFGNIMLKRYLKDAKYVKNALASGEIEKFNKTIELFQKYAGEYEFDWLLIGAQAFQESGIDQSVRSPAGAVGVMQVLPTTAADPTIGIANVDTDTNNNIHAGVKYLRFMVNEYFNDPAITPVNRHLFALASYNAGPNRIARLRQKAAKQGLDPNKWFQNVEIVVAREIGRETTQYVGNIYKYYIAYKRVLEQRAARREIKEQIK
jgi:membrane-bound lytic murein transglycosylase MltF